MEDSLEETLIISSALLIYSLFILASYFFFEDQLVKHQMLPYFVFSGLFSLSLLLVMTITSVKIIILGGLERKILSLDTINLVHPYVSGMFLISLYYHYEILVTDIFYIFKVLNLLFIFVGVSSFCYSLYSVYPNKNEIVVL